MKVATRASTVHTDATLATVAIVDTAHNAIMGQFHMGYQAHNEAAALFLAILHFGRTRRCCTDVMALLRLAKRSVFLLPFKTAVAVINPVIYFVSSQDNLADHPSRNPATWNTNMPKAAGALVPTHYAQASSYWTPRGRASLVNSSS